MEGIMEIFFLVLSLGLEALKWVNNVLSEGIIYGALAGAIIYLLIEQNRRLKVIESSLKQIHEKVDGWCGPSFHDT